MALDDYCPSLVYTLETAPMQRLGEILSPAQQSATVQGPNQVRYDLRWEFGDLTEAKALVAEFEAVGFTRAIQWTPPAGTIGNYRFAAFRPSFRSPSFAVVTATLVLFQGV